MSAEQTGDRRPKRLCVFCGSKVGRSPAYEAAARRLAEEAVARNWELVYGGGSVGLMGVLADAALKRGGRIYGVIPSALATPELAHPALTQLHVVPSMHQRKSLMLSLADALVALPGGLGTLEELLEAVTWAQLKLHSKPVAVLNVAHYFKPLLEFLDHAVQEGFLQPEHRRLLFVEEDPATLLALLDRRLESARSTVSRPELASTVEDICSRGPDITRG
jgi:uncharacterized protein (TIGR00730 family)